MDAQLCCLGQNKLRLGLKNWFDQLFLKMGHSRSLFLYFCLFYFNVQLVDKILPMLVFELGISDVGSDCSTN